MQQRHNYRFAVALSHVCLQIVVSLPILIVTKNEYGSLMILKLYNYDI